jgi:hypothetical protein
MKPHLRKIGFLWFCGEKRGFGLVLSNAGIGYTPAHAYADWQERNR